MAAPVVQVVLNGTRNYTISVVGEADTQGLKIVDVSAITADAIGVPAGVKLMRAEVNTDATIKLDWDANTDKTFAVFTPGQTNHDWSASGGLWNDAGTGVTGDVVIPVPAGTANYFMTLFFVKKYA
jgi:hypothetical protein